MEPPHEFYGFSMATVWLARACQDAIAEAANVVFPARDRKDGGKNTWMISAWWLDAEDGMILRFGFQVFINSSVLKKVLRIFHTYSKTSWPCHMGLQLKMGYPPQFEGIIYPGWWF